MLKRLTAPLRTTVNARFESIAGEVRALREETARRSAPPPQQIVEDLMAVTALLARKVDRMADGLDDLVERSESSAPSPARAAEIAFALLSIGTLPRGTSVLTIGLPSSHAAGLAALGYHVTAGEELPAEQADAVLLLSAGDLLGLGGVDRAPDVAAGRASLAAATERLRPDGLLVLSSRGARPLATGTTSWIGAVMSGWELDEVGTLRLHDASWTFAPGLEQVDPQDVALVRARKPVA